MRKLTTQEFIEKAQQIHQDRYDYSQTEYIDSRTKITIICKTHGPFKQIPNNHLRGADCPKCKGINLNTVDYIRRAKKIHNNKYDYSHTKYVKMNHKIKIICPEHGVFEQLASLHVNIQCGCPVCGGTGKLNTDGFINKGNDVHNNKYDYSLSKYRTSKLKIKIICPEHGVFEQTPNTHLQGSGCPTCRSSKGENTISRYLDDNNILYRREYKFEDCINSGTNYHLLFDFYLPELNICIEYDGIQHFKPIYFGKHSDKTKSQIKHLGEKNLNIIQKRDNIKTIYCERHNIKLIRITYKDNINLRLSCFIK